ncbi:MAG: NADAR family protein [Deltaproteobacteria bacterium]|nr:NADAR family protein [Deltaproteobacteria bacterium]
MCRRNTKEGAVTVCFYSTRGPFGCFSNFSAHPVEIDGVTWPTTEHYFQAQKFSGTAHAGEIRRARSPMVAARMGRSRQRPLRKDWESVKDEIMRRAVLAKIRQHQEVRELLLGTGEEVLVEDTTTDQYWGCGSDGKGRNRLGQILMEVRDLLRGEALKA